MRPSPDPRSYTMSAGPTRASFSIASATAYDVGSKPMSGMRAGTPPSDVPATVRAQEPEARIATTANKSRGREQDRKSTRLNSSHLVISYAVFCLKKKKEQY